MRPIPRVAYSRRAQELLGRFPVVAILGPRQAGKTTFARAEFPGFEYLDLERPTHARRLEGDAELFLRSRERPLILDEAQRAPHLFPILRSLVDERRDRPGQYVLLGSASFLLQRHISESLSGRIGFLDLTPLTLAEIARAPGFETHWLRGGFPDALLSGDASRVDFEWFDAYVRTLIERDLPALGVHVTVPEFGRLWAMCAHFHGNLLNMNKLAASLGISRGTVSRYLDILEQSFALRRLLPFHTNIKKRLVKTPKLYFRDSGLFHYFTRILSHEDLLASPERGASFEGYVVNAILEVLHLEAREWTPFFVRTSDQHEIDLVLQNGRKLVPIEIKCALSPAPRDLTSMQTLMGQLDCKRGFVISLGEDRYPISSEIECLGIHRWAAEGAGVFW